MKILRLLNLYRQAFFTAWALREINPLHPDVPHIVLRNRQLREEIAKLWAEFDRWIATT